MNKIISVANLKGGCAKTTTAHSIASLLGMEGYKVLVIDMDAQGSLTFASLGNMVFSKSISNVLLDMAPIEDVVINTRYFDIIPSTLELSIAELQLNGRYGREYILKEKLEGISDKYDYIILDCPPSTSLATMNALVASTHLLIPCECELFAIDGLALFFRFLKDVEKLNKELKVIGIVPTKLDNRRNVSKDAYNHLIGKYNCTNPIHHNSKLAEVGFDSLNIFEIDGKSRGAEDYRTLVENFIKKI